VPPISPTQNRKLNTSEAIGAKKIIMTHNSTKIGVATSTTTIMMMHDSTKVGIVGNVFVVTTRRVFGTVAVPHLIRNAYRTKMQFIAMRQRKRHLRSLAR
jgi:hypothetical protein